MKPIKFPEQNAIYAENQPEYLPLPVFKDENGVVISCWRLSFRERIKLLLTGNMWLSLMSFNKPLTPSFMTTNKADLFLPSKRDDKVIKNGIKLFNKLRDINK